MPLVKTKSLELAVYAKGDSASGKLAIVVPGRLDTKDYIHLTSIVDYLGQRGYYALAFDPPGTWESPGGIELYTTTNTIKAVDELIEYFGNKPTLLAGHSRGGTVVMLVGPQNTHVTHFVPIAAYYGAPSSPEESGDRMVNGIIPSYRDLPPGDHETKEQKEFLLPLSYIEDGKRYNALPGLRSCTKPKLFLYGINDDINDSEDVKEAYEVSADPKMIQSINSDHDIRYHPEAMREVNEAIGKFLDTYPA